MFSPRRTALNQCLNLKALHPTKTSKDQFINLVSVWPFFLFNSLPISSGAPQLQLVPWFSQISQRATLGHTFAIDHISDINHHQVGRFIPIDQVDHFSFIIDHINLWHRRRPGQPPARWGWCLGICDKSAAAALLHRNISVGKDGTEASTIWFVILESTVSVNLFIMSSNAAKWHQSQML